MKTLHSIPAYHKAAVVGIGLMLIMVCVVSVSFLSIETGFGTGRELVNDYYPALDTLLDVDRDLHAAQIALSNALPLESAAAREPYIREFEAHVARADGRFRAFDRATADLAGARGFVHLEKGGDGFHIPRIELDTVGRVPGIDSAKFQEQAEKAKQNCPVSKVLKGAEISLKARLEG
jgi:hypothetical protein